MPEIELPRRAFRRLIAANPNYFGTLQDKALAELLPVVEPKQSDTAYEEIGCVSYSPERDRLEATIVVKRAFGYRGDPCTRGSVEWVRFFVDFGSGWVDAGSTAARVFDVPDGKDCAGDADHPYVLVAGVILTPVRKFCATPVLPRVRAILSWDHEPTAGDPGYVPVWGEVQEDTIQIRPRRRFFVTDVGDLLEPVLKIDPDILKQLVDDEVLPIPIPEPDPIGPVALNPQPLPPKEGPVPTPFSLDKLLRIYAPEKLQVLAERATDRRIAKLALEPVPPHRMVADEVSAALSGNVSSFSLAKSALVYKELGISWGDLFDALDDGKGDTTYEELECLGLDDSAAQLVATFRVKRPTGFSGPPCSAGSKEYVAFWADFDDDCTSTYLGTVPVTTHDYITMPGTGLSYAAVLPLDLGAYRRLCKEPGLHRVRAVLSWNTAPSTTDPDAVPHWGNRLDAHVHVQPGRPYDGVARLTIVGGVPTAAINPATGVTTPVAHMHDGRPLDPRGCPFAGTVRVQGPADPALSGVLYRLVVRNVTAGGTDSPVMDPFYVVDDTPGGGVGSWITPGAGGWTPWRSYHQNTEGVLGHIRVSGDDLWETSLELSGSGVADTQRFQLDNTLNAASVDPANAAHLAFDAAQIAQQNCGKFTQGMTIHGTYDARDTWFGSWGFSLLPFPLPSTALTTSVLASTSEAPVGSTWSLTTSALGPCGYVLRLSVADRAIVDSYWLGHSTTVDIGFCIE
jgi:hypothetical protein